MVSEQMYKLGTKKSTIRTIFEYGQKRAAEVGAENVFDFSLGNPNVPAPDFIQAAAVDILLHSDPTEVHGYTIAPGKPQVRGALAADLNRRFGMNITAKNSSLRPRKRTISRSILQHLRLSLHRVRRQSS